MPQIEIDQQKVMVPEKASILDAAKALGKYIPHFCYHKKLSIAANCRMCLVSVDHSPKPLPACATPVVEGMKVYTHSEEAIAAQRGIIEFLLINHPLDCPICDKAGECKLQDLAVGYGQDASRFNEKKRTIPAKKMGSLILAEEMSRCIHCSRCIRFLNEIAGLGEIGIIHRSEHAQITSFFDRPINSEISGNIIDLCPVGALTSAPFRYSARSWELSRKRSVAPHDGFGSNLIVQATHNRVKRILPFENESINECWLSDRDRFSYEGLNSDDRLTKPMIKQDNRWHETDWHIALAYVTKNLTNIAAEHGKETIGVLAHPISTCEELYLLQKLFRLLGIYNIDSRPKRSDFRTDSLQKGAFWLGSTLENLNAAQSILTIGTTLRSEQPLLAARLRSLAKKGCAISSLHCVQENWLCKLFEQITVPPSELSDQLKQILKALLAITGKKGACDLADIVPTQTTQNIAKNLLKSPKTFLILGQAAQHHPDFSVILSLTEQIAQLGGFNYGLLGEAGNSVGAELTGVLPHFGPFFSQVTSGFNSIEMFTIPQKAYFLLNIEPELDCYDSTLALHALQEARTVIACTAFKGNGLLEYADVLLPITPFTETAGSFVNQEGRWQSFCAAVAPLGEARPAWKVLCALAQFWQLKNFKYGSAQAVSNEWLSLGAISDYLGNTLKEPAFNKTMSDSSTLQRIGEIPIYQGDAIVRRAQSLQQTAQASLPMAKVNPQTAKIYGVKDQSTIQVSQAHVAIKIPLNIDPTIPDHCLHLPGSCAATVGLGGLFDPIEIASA